MNMNDFIEVLQEMGVRHSIDGDKIFVAKNLNLYDPSITSLPDNLSVGGWFNLRRTGISSLPDNLKVSRFIHLHPEKITNIAYRKFWSHGDYTVFAAWINGECCVVVNEKIYTLGEFFRGAPAADVAKAARECVAELTQRWKGAGGSMNDKKPIPIPLNGIPDDEAMAGLRFLRDSGWSLEQILEVYEKLLRQEGAA